VEAAARGRLGATLIGGDVERQRGFDLIRRAVALRPQVLRTAAPGDDTLNAQRMLADQLSSLGGVVYDLGLDGLLAEAEACLREALALAEGVGGVGLAVRTLTLGCLINLCGEAPTAVRLAEAEVFRSRLNQLLVQMGRSPETDCSICLEPLAPPADGAAEDAAGGRGNGGAGGPADLCVRVIFICNHQFHLGCLSTWRRTTSSHKYKCPLCKT